MIDKTINGFDLDFANLKQTIMKFLKKYCGEDYRNLELQTLEELAQFLIDEAE